MRVKSWILGLAVVGTLPFQTPALAQNGPRDAAAAKAPAAKPSKGGWLHIRTNTQLPKQLGQMKPDGGRSYADFGSDWSVQYNTPDNEEVVSVYFTLAGAGDASLWFHMANSAIALRPQLFANLRPAVGPEPFAAPGQSVPASMRVVYDTDGSFKSTALVMIPYGEHFVKVRYSNANDTGTVAAAKLDGYLQELGLLNSGDRHQPAYRIDQCSDAIVFDEGAKEFPDREVIMGSTSLLLIDTMTQSLPFPPNAAFELAAPQSGQYCQDPAVEEIYRWNGSKESYIFPYSDAFRSVFVRKSPEKNNGEPSYFLIQNWDIPFTKQLAPQTGLPSLQGTTSLLETEPLVAATNRTQPNTLIVNSAVLEKKE